MKKLIVLLCLAVFLMLSVCISITPEMKIDCKCRLGLSGGAPTNNNEPNEDDKNKISGSPLLPFNSWDTKMMIW